MVATIGQMASAAYYLESQRSFRHPNEYYTAGEEPDGTWFNPRGLLGLKDGQKVDSGHFHRLYAGFSPDGERKLVQRAGNPDRSPGVDLTFSVDKSVSSLWALAEPEMRQHIEAMAVSAARAAIEDTVFRYCAYTRVGSNGVTRPAEADLMGATFVHGTSRENDPQLHVHCTIFNLARTREDGTWRAHHQYPVYSWKKAAGALFRAYMAWDLQQNLGVRMDQYGPNAEFTRVRGMPEDLQSFWSKRRKAIVAKAGELGIPSLGNASRMAGVNKITRAGKSHDNDPEVRHRRWREEAQDYVEREELIATVTGHEVEIERERIRELSERHGAKVVFAGDTRQQQPVEAGPGLRLIRDVAGSIRVDRIRRQKADLEDVLVHVHKETPEQAQFQAALTPPQERDAIVAGYEAMERKPVFTPWQVAVSEALRDGEAEKAIEAWHLRGRLHLCHDEEKTITRLVDDWARHVNAEPGSSTVVLARTRAETRALSWLMRERVLAGKTDAERAVIEVSREVDGRKTEPLEIAVGDRLRIGATQWEKQLFNGTVVTVERIEMRIEMHPEVRRGGNTAVSDTAVSDTAVSRKARNRRAGRAAGRGAGTEARDRSPRGRTGEDEPSVLITARTDDGRKVTFRHDEIRDFRGNVRLDYGYAMTIASAQGLTVDRAFLLVDDRPARETIYPAATRHREGIDVYVNRSPIAFDLAERRPEDEADRPVLDSDVRAYLVERWSRSEPKEAALDYVAGGAWRDPREANGRSRPDGMRQPGAAHANAANDNALVRIAGEIRHAAAGWRHGAAVDAFAAERAEVLAAWDDLRARVRDEGEAVALSPAFRETLDRHGALMKQAASFTARPRTFERLLSERAGIGDGELRELRDVHARAGSYLRSATARAAHARQNTEGASEQTRQNAEGESEQARRHGEPAPEPARQTASAAETAPPDPPAAQTSRDTGADAAPVRPAAEAPARSEAPMDVSRAAYRWLRRDWQAHLDRARRQGEHRFDLDGAAALIERIAAFTGSQWLAAEARARLEEIVGEYRAHAAARDRVRGFLRDVERHWLRYRTITHRERDHDIPRQEQRSWPIWLDRNERLLREGRAILDDPSTYRAHLDRIEDGRERLPTEVSRLERFSSAYRAQSRSRDKGRSWSM